LIKTGLKIARALRPEGEEVTQNGGQNQQRDNARPVHEKCGMPLANGSAETITSKALAVPRSKFRIPDST
jgi:hypothetical protein